MKKVIIISMFSLLFSIVAKSQAVVTDPALLTATTTNWAEQLAIAGKQADEMYNQTQLLQETIDKFKKVNSIIKNFTMIKNIIDKQVTVLTTISSARAEAKNDIQHQDGYEAFINKLDTYTNAINENIELLDALFTEGLNMTDYERLQMSMQVDEKSTTTLQSVKADVASYKKFNENIKQINNLIKN